MVKIFSIEADETTQYSPFELPDHIWDLLVRIKDQSILNDWCEPSMDISDAAFSKVERDFEPICSPYLPLMSNQAYTELREKFEQFGEFLPLNYKESKYWIFNCLNVVDCIDFEKSKFEYITPKTISEIYKLVLDGSKIADLNTLIFRLKALENRALYISSDIADFIDSLGLTGYILREQKIV